MIRSIDVDFRGARARAPNNWETPTLSSVITTLCSHILVCPIIFLTSLPQWSQIITDVELNCTAAMQGAHHVTHPNNQHRRLGEEGLINLRGNNGGEHGSSAPRASLLPTILRSPINGTDEQRLSQKIFGSLDFGDFIGRINVYFGVL